MTKILKNHYSFFMDRYVDDDITESTSKEYVVSAVNDSVLIMDRFVEFLLATGCSEIQVHNLMKAKVEEMEAYE